MKSQKEEIRRRRQEREEQMAIHVVEQEDSTDKSTSRSSSAPLLDKSRKDSSPVKVWQNSTSVLADVDRTSSSRFLVSSTSHKYYRRTTPQNKSLIYGMASTCRGQGGLVGDTCQLPFL